MALSAARTGCRRGGGRLDVFLISEGGGAKSGEGQEGGYSGNGAYWILFMLKLCTTLCICLRRCTGKWAAYQEVSTK